MAITIHGKLQSKQIKKDTIVIDKKIYGINYPFLSGKRGFFSKQAGVELVKNNLKQLLGTERGERIMLPNFGVSLRKYLFEPLDQGTVNSIKSEILTSISNYMPNVNVLKLAIFNTEDIGIYGVPGLKIDLVLELNDIDPQLIDLTVKVG